MFVGTIIIILPTGLHTLKITFVSKRGAKYPFGTKISAEEAQLEPVISNFSPNQIRSESPAGRIELDLIRAEVRNNRL